MGIEIVMRSAMLRERMEIRSDRDKERRRWTRRMKLGCATSSRLIAGVECDGRSDAMNSVQVVA